MPISHLFHSFACASAVLSVPLASFAQPPAQGPSAVQRQLINVPGPLPIDCPVAAAAAVAELPDDADLIIVVENASELRATPVGDAATRFLEDSGIEGLSKAWDGLAAQLGWSKSETFDRLLGKRVVLISKSIAPGNDRRWAILSDVSADTETRLKERLQAAPRAIEQGHQILALENGEYELTSHHHAAPASKTGPKRAASTDRVTLVLGPAGKGELFDQLVGILNRNGAPPANTGRMSATDVFSQACQAGPTEVLVLSALDPSGPDAAAPRPPAERWKNFALLAARRDRNDAAAAAGDGLCATWRSRIVVRQTERREELMKLELSNDAGFRALDSGSLFAMVQNAPLPAVLGQWAPGFANILSIIPIPEDALRQMTARQAVCIRTVGGGGVGGGGVGVGGLISCTLARQTLDTQKLACMLDPEITREVHRIEKQFGVEAPPPQDYGGIACNAVRTTPLASSTTGMLSVLTSRPLAVSWAYPSQIAVNGPANLNDPAVRQGVCAAGCVGNNRPGWWVFNVSQTDPAPALPVPPAPQQGELVRHELAPEPCAAKTTPGELLRSDANALLTTAPLEGCELQTARWVWLAAARPAKLEQLLPAAVPDFNGFRSALRRFESVNLELQITEQGDIRGDLGLRLTQTAK